MTSNANVVAGVGDASTGDAAHEDDAPGASVGDEVEYASVSDSSEDDEPTLPTASARAAHSTPSKAATAGAGAGAGAGSSSALKRKLTTPSGGAPTSAARKPSSSAKKVRVEE
ncbi:hypothetical protein EON67_00690 [archaeon]|nr:MAG: hypothetical protein EON67_00690 [archaeon]